MLPSNLQQPVGWLLIAVAILIVAVLFVRHIGHNRQRARARQPQKTLAQHIRTHAVHHISAALLAVIGVAVLLGVGVAYVLLHHGGAVFQRNLHIAPHTVTIPGAAGGTTSNLAAYLPPPYDQGNTNFCWSFSTSAALYITEHQRGATVMPAPSPWRTAWYETGGQNTTGTLAEAVAGINGYGEEPLAYWPSWGPPDASDPGRTTAYSGATATTLWYGSGYGAAGYNAIVSQINAGHPVVILWQVYANALTNGQPTVNDSGGFEFYHFSVVYAVTSAGLMVRNSWGSAWGNGGDALMTQATAEADVLAASIISPGQAVTAWYPPRPTPTPTATPPPKPKPTPTPRPVACTSKTVTTVRAVNLRSGPGTGYKAVVGESKGTRLQTLCPAQVTSHWIRLYSPPQRTSGWVLKTAI